MVAGAVPKWTAVAPVRCRPVMVTEVPPAGGPTLGLMPVTIGPAVYVNLSSGLAGEPLRAVVTRTSTIPDPAGAVARRESDVSGTTLVAGVPPKVTPVGLSRNCPITLTWVPPANGPEFGSTALTDALPAILVVASVGGGLSRAIAGAETGGIGALDG